jgi:hypothetical protein
MAKVVRTATIFCLAIWAVIWLVFLLIHFSPLDIRNIPGGGMFLLAALLVALAAPVVATALAGMALFRQPRLPLNRLTFGCAVGALCGQALLFLVSRWM